MEVHLGEVPAGTDGIDRNPGGSRRYRMMRLTLDEGTRTYRVAITPDKRNTGSRAIKMPKDIGEVMPFRYCEIVNSPSALDATKVCQITVHYPFDEAASHFTSSSQILNDVWDLCKYSIKATSFCGVYVDGDRERIPYEADAYINQLGHYCVDREYTMARYTHEYLITRPTWPTEWILHSVLMAWADYLYTGDRDSIEYYYDDLKAKTLLALARADGLISTQTGLVTDEVLKSIHFNGKLRDIVDWPHGNILGLKGGYGETDDFEFRPINTVVNAFHYQALVAMTRIANDLGKLDDAGQFSKAAARVRQSFNDKLLDKAKGIYVDGEGSTHSALHANMFPLAFGLVPPEHLASVAAFVKSRGMVCSVYGSQYLLDALYEAGEGDFALDLMTDPLHGPKLAAHGLRCGHYHHAGGLGQQVQAQPGLEPRLGRRPGQYHPSAFDGCPAAGAGLRPRPAQAPGRLANQRQSRPPTPYGAQSTWISSPCRVNRSS